MSKDREQVFGETQSAPDATRGVLVVARSVRSRLLSGPRAPFDVGLLSPVSAGRDTEVSDAAVLRAMIDAELALVRAFRAAGVVSEVIVKSIARDISAAELDAAVLAERAVSSGNPVVPLVAMLREAVDPYHAEWIHKGATSQDILDTALMLLSRRAIEAIDVKLQRTAASLAKLASANQATPAAARTLTQHSAPTTLGLRFAGWLEHLEEARTALVDAGDRLPVQLGGTSGTLGAFVEQLGEVSAARMPGRFAAELGLREPLLPWHTSRRPVTRLGDALAGVCDALGVIAADVATLSRSEISELAEGGGDGPASAVRRRPSRSVLIRSAALRAPGLAAQLHLAAATAVDERPDGAWHTEWPALREMLRLALGASALAAELAAGLTVNAAAVRRNLRLTGPLIVSERLMIALAPRLGAERMQELIDRAACGEDLVALLRNEPGIDAALVQRLVDPAGHTGLAADLTAAAVARYRDDER